jgi:parvulin-like peptidyl-prolyl isomerase
LAKKEKNIAKKNNNGSKGLKVYKVNGNAPKEDSKARRNKNIQTFLIVLIIILAIAAIFSAIQTFFPNLLGKISLAGELAATVNGKPITIQKLNAEYDRLPLQYQYFVTKEAFLTQLIDEVLLTEEAAKQKLSVSEKEVDNSLGTFMKDNNLTQENLTVILKQKKITQQDLRDLIKSQLLIDKLIEQNVKSKVNVTSALALQYYNDNPDTFKVPEQVTARHILIGLVNRTNDEAKKKAEEVLVKLKEDKSNFCDLVKQYSDDSGSIDKCGEYTFSRGQMVEEFEKTAFEQGIGKLSLVNTTFGYHIIWTINKTPEQLVLFKDVEDQINLVLANQQEKQLYGDLIAKLRANAKIINYLEKKALENKTETKIKEEPQQNASAATQTQVTIVEPAEKEGAAEEEEPLAEEEEISKEQKELENETQKAVEEVTEEKPATQPVQETKLSFANCLAGQGAVLYGAYWDSSTKKQKDYFGIDVTNINYIECGVPDDFRAQAEICQEAGIQAYPTWIINSEKHMGIQELKQLATLTGCDI